MHQLPLCMGCTTDCRQLTRYHKVKIIFMELAVELFLGWSATFQENMLTLYELSCLDSNTGPVVAKSIKLKSDFSWTVTYKGHLVSHQSQVLYNLPSVGNTGKSSY